MLFAVTVIMYVHSMRSKQKSLVTFDQHGIISMPFIKSDEEVFHRPF